jgi:hypothetical protein
MARTRNNSKIHRVAAALAVALILGVGVGALGAAGRSVAGIGLAHTFDTDRGYYAMTNGRLEKWDFHSDGTFLHEGIAGGVGAFSRGSQSGTYSIEGDKLILKIGKTATAAGAGAGASSMLSGSAKTATETREMKIQLLGADGADGVVLNGVTFNIRHGW